MILTISKTADQNLCDLVMFVLSTIINHKENSYDSNEVIAAVNNDPDFLIQTIEHISRSRCMSQLSKKLEIEKNSPYLGGTRETVYKLLDDIKAKTAAEKTA